MTNHSTKRRFSDLRILVVGVLIGALLFGGVSAIAESSIFAEPTTSRLYVDGGEISVEAYTIDDSTYLKVRDIAKVLDIGLWYDEAKDSVYIETDIGYDPRYTGVRKEVATPIAPLQKSVAVNVDNKKLFDLDKSATEAFSATVTIVEVLRGAEAADLVKNAYVHNPSAGMGKEFVLAWVRAKITDSKNKNNVVLSDIRMNMRCYSGDGDAYVVANPTNINPINEQPKSVGDTVEGWIAFAVDRNDPEPRVRIGKMEDDSDYAWFALYD
jgi:hypothetical protein